MRLVPLQSLTPDDLSEWDRLAQRAIEPNPFFEPAFVAAAAKLERDDAVQVLFEERDGAWTGCIPVLRRRMPFATVLSSWRSPYSYLGTPLVDRDDAAAFSTALIESLRAGDHGRFLLLQRTSKGSVREAIARAGRDSGKIAVLFEQSDERAALHRREEADYLSGMKSRKRSELKRQRRKLDEELGGGLTARELTDTPAAVEAFLRLEAAGWKGREGTAMASDERSAELFRSICRSFAERNRLVMRSLEAGDRIAAMTCDLSAGDVLFGFKAAYDEQLGRYSPGVQLQVENFSAFHDRPESFLDSCAEPSNEKANALWPDRRPIDTILLGSPWPLGRAMGAVAKRVAETRRRQASSPPTASDKPKKEDAP